MSEQAGSLHLDVVADTTGFRRDLAAKVTAEARNVTARVRAEVDSRGLRTAVRAAVRDAQQAATVKVATDLNTRGLRTAVRAAVREAQADAQVRVRMVVDNRGLRTAVRASVREAQADAQIKTRMDLDARSLRATVRAAAAQASADARVRASMDVDADTTKARAEVAAVKAAADKGTARIRLEVVDGDAARRLTSISGAITRVVGVAGLVGSAVGPVLQLAGGIGQAGAGLLAMAANATQASAAIAALPAAAAGAAAAVGTVKAAFSGIPEAIKAVTAAHAAQGRSAAQAETANRNLEQAMSNLTPQGRSLVRFLTNEFIPAWKVVRDTAQAALLPDAQASLGALTRLVGPVNRVVQDTASTLGDLMRATAATITTPLWQSDLVRIGSANATAINDLGRAAITLLNPLRDIAVVAGDGPNSIVQRFARWTRVLADNTAASVAAGRENGTLAGNLDRAGDTIAQWGRIVGNILGGIRGILRESAPAGQALTDSFEQATADFNAWANGDGAKTLRDFFDAAIPVAQAFGRVLLGLGGILGRIMSDPNNAKTMTAIETKLVPALSRLVQAFQDSGTTEKFVDLLVRFADLVTNLVESGALGTFMDVLGAVVGFLDDISKTDVGKGGFKLLFGALAILGPLGLVAGAVGRILGGLRAIGRLGVVKQLVQVVYTGTGKRVAGKGQPSGAASLGGAAADVAVDAATDELLDRKTGGKGAGGKRIRVSGKAGRLRRLGSLASSLADDVVGAVRTSLTSRSAAKAGGGVKGLLGRAGKAIGGKGVSLASKGVRAAGGPIGAIAGIAGGYVADNYISDGKKGGRDALGGAISGGLTGAAIGGTIGSIVPGLGTAVGAVAGGGIGAAAGAMNKLGEDALLGYAKGFHDKMLEFGKGIGGFFDRYVIKPVKDFFGIASPSRLMISIAGDVVAGFIQGWATLPGRARTAITDLAGRVGGWFAGVKDTLGARATDAATTAGAKLGAVKGAVQTALTTLPGSITAWWGGVSKTWGEKWDGLRTAAGGKVAAVRTGVKGFLDTLPGNINAWWAGTSTTWGARWEGARKTAADKLTATKNGVKGFMDALPGNITAWWARTSTTWGGRWEGARSVAASKLGAVKTGMKGFLDALPGNITGWWQRTGTTWGGKFDGLRSKANATLDAIKRSMGTKMGQLGTVFSDGMDVIGRAWDKIKAKAANPINVMIRFINKPLLSGLDRLGAAVGFKGFHFQLPQIKLASGGKVPGRPPGYGIDNVPALIDGRYNKPAAIASGEWVVSNPAVDYYGDPFLKAVNERRIPREAVNAMMPKPNPNRVTGAHGPGFSEGGKVPSLIAWGRDLLRRGFAVRENNAIEPVDPVHAPGSYHYRYGGRGALDISGGGGMSAWLRLAAEANKHGFRSILRYPGHYNHLHADVSDGPNLGDIPKRGKGILGKITDFFSSGLDAVKGLFNPFKTTVNNALRGVSDGTTMGGLMRSSAGKAASTALAWARNKVFSFGESLLGMDTGPSAGSGVERWRSVVLQALRLVGQPASLANTTLRRMNQESGGNPRAINNWDINAKNGDPSRGLMQVIGATFRRFRLPSLPNDIYNPLSNIVASMRYALSTYGSLAAAYNRKGGYALGGKVADIARSVGARLYDTGGVLPHGAAALNLSKRPEAVLTGQQWSLITRLVASTADTSRVDTAQLAALNRLVALQVTANATPRVQAGVNIQPGAVVFHVAQTGDSPTAYETTLNEGLRKAAAFGIFDGAGR